MIDSASHCSGAPPALIVVAAVLVDTIGRIGVQRRPDGREHAGLWEFPGGKLEPGEGPRAALVRELAEELAIAVDPAAFTALGFAGSEGTPGTRPVVLLLFGCRDWTGDPVSQEGAAWQWCEPGALSALAMPPLDEPLVPLALCFANRATKPLAKPGAAP